MLWKVIMLDKLKNILNLISMVLFFSLMPALPFVIMSRKSGGSWKDIFIGLLCFEVVLSIFCLVVYLVTTASEKRKGVVYNFVEIVNAISILIVIVATVYIAILGISEFYGQSLCLFIIVLCSATFAVYYWYQKKARLEAEERDLILKKAGLLKDNE
jgi:purine-cytosine permease-like protein